MEAENDIKGFTNRKNCNRSDSWRRRCTAASFSGYGIDSDCIGYDVKYAPMGDPVEVRIHSYELTLRLADARR